MSDDLPEPGSEAWQDRIDAAMDPYTESDISDGSTDFGGDGDGAAGEIPSGYVRAAEREGPTQSEQISDIEDKHGDVDERNTELTDEGGLRTETGDHGTVVDNPGDPEGGVDVTTADNRSGPGAVATALDGVMSGVDTRTVLLGAGALAAVLVGLSVVGGDGAAAAPAAAAANGPPGGGA
ncbi:hypothetical protein [Halostella salina]|uniref:hypothetical protein n=1 Tax=Halostella salina TaxID=1547897 RepID=UPI000EF7DC12|nr:hypothetical protein [Halostella salina]